jgi:hypothetical protein
MTNHLKIDVLVVRLLGGYVDLCLRKIIVDTDSLLYE